MDVLFGVFVTYEHFEWVFEARMGCHFHMPVELAVDGAEKACAPFEGHFEYFWRASILYCCSRSDGLVLSLASRITDSSGVPW